MHSSFPPRSSTSRRHSELHRTPRSGVEASRTRRASLPEQSKNKTSKRVSDKHKQTINKRTRQIDTHANKVGSDAVRNSKISRVDWATTDTGCPPIPKKLLGSRVTHNRVKQCLTQGISGNYWSAYCAFGPKGIECMLYSIVDKGTARQ